MQEKKTATQRFQDRDLPAGIDLRPVDSFYKPMARFYDWNAPKWMPPKALTQGAEAWTLLDKGVRKAKANLQTTMGPDVKGKDRNRHVIDGADLNSGHGQYRQGGNE